MAYVITRICRECLDTGCVAVCPIACIYESPHGDASWIPHQLYIEPDDCIDCGACEPECPWQAIFEEARVPPELAEDVALNRNVFRDGAQLRLADYRTSRRPTAEEVAAAHRRWIGGDAAALGGS